MKNYIKRGYIVKEPGTVYYTEDMDKTFNWFKNILGWYGDIVERDGDNKGCYGAVFDMPNEIERLNVMPFTGIHLFYGEPVKRLLAFMKVENIEMLNKYVKNNGWDKITEISAEPWGAASCVIETIDGTLIKFFETK